MKLALISLERWDDTWRRNQHLAAGLVRSGVARNVVFVEPPERGMHSMGKAQPFGGVRVLSPPLRAPRSLGGLAAAARELAVEISGADLLWVNEPTLGARLLDRRPALYDVTDDWRSFDLTGRARRRVVRAEDRLALKARTVVCSPELERRWTDRYGVQVEVVPNGAPLDAYTGVEPHRFADPGPHIGYVGTLHPARLDVDLVDALLSAVSPARLHLIGPNHLDRSAEARLRAHENLVMTGPMPSERVPAVLVGLDLLICPHRVTPFTLSLDAIKRYEYQASGRPVVATPTSGFQSDDIRDELLHVAGPGDFVDRVLRLLSQLPLGRAPGAIAAATWESSVARFATVLADMCPP